MGIRAALESASRASAFALFLVVTQHDARDEVSPVARLGAQQVQTDAQRQRVEHVVHFPVRVVGLAFLLRLEAGDGPAGDQLRELRQFALNLVGVTLVVFLAKRRTRSSTTKKAGITGCNS